MPMKSGEYNRARQIERELQRLREGTDALVKHIDKAPFGDISVKSAAINAARDEYAEQRNKLQAELDSLFEED